MINQSDETINQAPWLNELGNFDENFIHWIAQDFAKQYGHQLSKAKLNARSMLRNNPNKVSDYWLSYQENIKDIRSF